MRLLLVVAGLLTALLLVAGGAGAIWSLLYQIGFAASIPTATGVVQVALVVLVLFAFLHSR